ncbi:uncharacterized protein [Miscanthus floridulus]|uniref:uncharacterized protein n=1 Tax=Miscanthus floridulus TaxID=154761 RepID=UPI00345AC8E0
MYTCLGGFPSLPSFPMSTMPATVSGSMQATGNGTLPTTGTGTMGALSAELALAPIVAHSYAMMNIKSHVPITLELNSNYSKWAFFFKSLCGKFRLHKHIDGSAPPQPTDPEWDAVECCVCGWILDFIDDSVLDLTMDEPNSNAHDLWVTIEEIFHVNKEPRAIFLLNEFHSMVQGDSTILAHYQRLKTKATALRDVGHPMEDSQLILTLLRGLNPRFSNTVDNIANSTVLPSFGRAHDMLVLKEICLANDKKTIVNTASPWPALAAPV